MEEEELETWTSGDESLASSSNATSSSQVVDVYICVTSGEVGTASSLTPKIEPRLSPKKIGEDIAKELEGTVKEIIGTCVSVGCTVDEKDPKDLREEIGDGEVDIPSD